MGLLDQETQVRHSDVYDDTLAAGSGLESPAAANQNILFDLNALRSQLRRIIDPQGLSGTADWFVDLASALDNFGLRQIHDKKFVFRSPITPGTNDFTLTGTPGGVVIDASMLVGASGTIAVGPSSAEEGGYVAATEAAFTVAGTLGIGTSQALDGDGILLNKVEIIDDATNEAPVDGATTIFGLLQSLTGAADGTSIAAAASENIQISFVKIDPGTDTVTAVTLPAGTYHFGLPRQRCFYALSRGAIISGVDGLPDAIGPSSTAVRLPFRHFDVTSPVAASDPLHVQTGVFTTAGATTVFATFGTPVLPASAAEFRDDERVKVYRNGNLQSKGTGKDVVWVSATQLAFSKKVKNGDEIVIISPATF